MEQAVIEESVKLDLENKRVTVELPFMKDPVKYLEEKHGLDSNYSQAKRVYVTQCRKPDHIKNGVRKAHAELLKKDFMRKLANLDQDKHLEEYCIIVYFKIYRRFYCLTLRFKGYCMGVYFIIYRRFYWLTSNLTSNEGLHMVVYT